MTNKDQPHVFDVSKVLARVSDRADGTMKSNGADDISEVSGNIRAFATRAGFSYSNIVAMNVGVQAVWDKIEPVISAPPRALVAIEDRVPTDALVTTRKDVVLMLPVADCNAVAIHDPVREVLALVHLGWQSTAVDLARKIVEYMQRQHQSRPEDLRIYISPSIRHESYIFDDISQAGQPQWQPFLHKTEKGIGIDLPGYNRQRFIEAGVPEAAIETCPVNTATSEDYFSHYRAVRTGESDGRFALFAALQ